MTNMTARMREEGYTMTALAKEIGCTKAAISKYAGGKANPSKKMKEAIAKALSIPPEELFLQREEEPKEPDPDVMTVGEAARAMQKSELFIRVGIREGVLPFGFAVKTGQHRYSYFISRRKFEESTGIRER